ncbi:hypothetical protein [Marinifilum caeruleilacunae]|uniref:DUF4369 domain-containing protein n=1 Tax=Marinifilum caeruleilacunae TaxID=2499076 RepID=A0ABX1WR19_9BACT|nr:hypothetical protein [Marinifilum caeruleilacunae]NOU58491.1 hypothetical protein [Marinifilum caeruleilacunae]
MKTKFLTLLAFLLLSGAFIANAQKCNYTHEKIDEFSGKVERRILKSHNFYFKFAFYRLGDDFRLESYVNIPGDQAFLIPEGSKLHLKLGDKSVMELTSIKNATPQSFVAANQIFSGFAMTYPITKEQLKKIEEVGIKFVRTYLKDESYYDMDFKKKKIEKTKNYAQCILAD